LARNLADTSIEGSPAQRTGERLMEERIDVAPVLQSALDGDTEAVTGFARERQLDPQAFARLLELALQPVLWEAAVRCAALTDVAKTTVFVTDFETFFLSQILSVTFTVFGPE